MGAEWYFNRFYHLIKGWEPPHVRGRLGYNLVSTSPLVSEWSKNKVGSRLITAGKGTDSGFGTYYPDGVYLFPFEWNAYTVSHIGSLESGFGYLGNDDKNYMHRTTAWEFTDDDGNVTASGSYTDSKVFEGYDPDTGFDFSTERSGGEPTGDEVGSRSDDVTYSTTVASQWGTFWTAFYNATLSDEDFSANDPNDLKAWREEDDNGNISEARVRYEIKLSIPLSAWDGHYENFPDIQVDWKEVELPEENYFEGIANWAYETPLIDGESKYSAYGLAVDVGLDEIPWAIVVGQFDFYDELTTMGSEFDNYVIDKESTTAPKSIRLGLSFSPGNIDSTKYGLIIYEAYDSVDLDFYFNVFTADGNREEYNSTITVMPESGKRVTDFTAQAVAAINAVIASLNPSDALDFAEINVADTSLNVGLVGKAIFLRNRGIRSGLTYYKKAVLAPSGGKDSGLTITAEADLTTNPVVERDKRDVTVNDSRSGTRTEQSEILSVSGTTPVSKILTSGEYSLAASSGNEKGIDSVYVKLGDRRFLLEGLF